MRPADVADPRFHLSVRDLVVTGDRGRTILSVPTLDLPAGSALGIRGPSGAGKTTFLFALAGLTERVVGAVHWGKQDVLGLGPDARALFRARNIGLIFQDFLLFDEMDAAGNAALSALFAPQGDRVALRQRAMAGLITLGLAETSGRRVASFSGGERQRVAVARALSADPAIVLADEPTASLDRGAADRLAEQLLAEVAGYGRTLIAVSHDAHLLARMDRVIDLADGQLAGEEER